LKWLFPERETEVDLPAPLTTVVEGPALATAELVVPGPVAVIAFDLVDRTEASLAA